MAYFEATPACDFLRRVEVWQQDDSGTAGIVVALSEHEGQTLSALLAALGTQGASADLEQRARTWLIGYAEMHPPLTPGQQSELDAIIDQILPSAKITRPVRAPARRRSTPEMTSVYRVVAAIVIALILAVGVRVAWGAMNPANNVRTGTPVSQNQLPQEVPPAATDLQNFKSDWGTWHQVPASEQAPQTGAPAMLLLQDGVYLVSNRWTIPAQSPAWTHDMGGNTGGIDVKGNYAVITDAALNKYVVAIDQPFVFATNPSVVLKVDSTGTVWAIPEAHATSSSVRTALVK